MGLVGTRKIYEPSQFVVREDWQRVNKVSGMPSFLILTSQFCLGG